MSGFEDVEHAYNRDFFSYNPDNGKFTFLRKSGTWEIYYSSKYNYIWVARMGDTAPTCFWLVGHGFTCAPSGMKHIIVEAGIWKTYHS